MENVNALQKLLDFIGRLEQEKIWYRIQCVRSEAIMVEAVVPGEHWEVEFLADGRVEVEVFRSFGGVDDESRLVEFFERFALDAP